MVLKRAKIGFRILQFLGLALRQANSFQSQVACHPKEVRAQRTAIHVESSTLNQRQEGFLEDVFSGGPRTGEPPRETEQWRPVTMVERQKRTLLSTPGRL